MKSPAIPDNDAARVARLESYSVLDTPPERAFDDLVDLASYIMGVPIALVSLVDGHRQWFKARHGLDAPETPRDVSFCGHVVADDQMLVVGDAHADERFADNPLVLNAPSVRFYAGAPLRTADGFTLGTLCAIDHEPREPTEVQLEMLQALARQAMSQLELRRQMQVLRDQRGESEAFFRLSLDLHCVAGFDGVFKQLNPSWERTLGWSRAELCGKPFVEFVHEDDREMTIEEAGRLSESATTTVVFENRYRCKDGSYRTLSWKAASDPATERVYAVARDVTAERAVDAMKSEFVSVVSHELRTPLTSIRGALKMVHEGVAGELPDKAAALIGIASKNTERLVRLVNDILDLEKIESGKLELNIRPHALAPVVDEVIRSLQGVAQPAEVSLRVEHDGPAEVLADRDSLLIVLTNLVSNAVKFSAPGDEVVLHVKRAGTGVRFEVVDVGPGIAVADQPKLFQRFQQLDSSDTRARSGSGLGLAISKAIVEEHGGNIGLESVLGEGSSFFFDLPGDVPISVASASSTVLLVEDDRDVAQVLAATLASTSCEVIHAASLEAARACLQDRAFDAVLLDVGLPDGSGLELIRFMRQDERLAETPVVVISGAEPTDNPWLVDWLQKPIDSDVLFRTLRRLTRRPGPPRALVVEDDEGARSVLLAQLAANGIEAIGAGTGQEAILLGQEEPPDLIILDVGLPDLDGFEVVRRLKATHARSSPMIVYTGRDLSAEERARLQLGDTEHLTKSRVSDDGFIGTVRAFLDDLLTERTASDDG